MVRKLQELLLHVRYAYKNTVDSQSKSVKNGDTFNVFNVIGLWGEEVRLHSAMIKELLDPSGSHGCSDQFLKIFLRYVLDINVTDEVSLTKAIVDSEFYIGPISTDGNEGGRIDIIVNIPEKLNLPNLIIENKIYAADQEKQLLRYHNYGTKTFNNNFRLIYLTLTGKSPSDWSVGGETYIAPKCISYRTNIISWLHKCAQVSFDKPRVRETIVQYIDILKQISDYTMNKVDEIVNTVSSSRENLISGLLICSRKNDLIKKVIVDEISPVLQKVARRAEFQNNLLQVEYIPYKDFEEKGDKIDWGFTFKISSKNGSTHIGLKYSFERWDLGDLFYGIDKTQTSIGVPATPVFPNPDENWPWGWQWAPEKYKKWDCERLCEILNQIKEKGSNSDFANVILNAIIEASTLLTGANVELTN